MMTTPKTPIRAKVQRELSALAGEAHAIGLQLDHLRTQLEANHERVAKLADFLQTLAEFETQEPPGGRRVGYDLGVGAGTVAGVGAVAFAGSAPPPFPPPAAASALPLAVPVHLGPADAAATDPDAIREFVARELAEAAELSTRDLLERLRRQGYALPGREPLGELSAILSGSVAFRNEDRLWYLVTKSLPGRPLDAGVARGGGAAPVFGSSSLPGPTSA